MKFVINTRYDHNSAGYRVCVKYLSGLLRQAGYHVALDDWDHYDGYDVALFMPYDSEIDKAKRVNPRILTGLMDPKLAKKRARDEAKRADFLMVSSVEQRDAFLGVNKNIFIYYMFPLVPSQEKIHKPKEKLVIGYHGNKIHLDAMYPDLTNALSRLACKYDLEFLAIYDVKSLGKWKHGVPKMPVRHIQWEDSTYLDYLKEADIGVVPSKTPVNLFAAKYLTELWWLKFLGYNLGYNKKDYVLRLKYSSGPGRIPVFSWLGIPVVADMYASSAEVILDGESGYLAHSTEGWEWALERLIKDPGLRNKLAANSRNFFDTVLSREKVFSDLMVFIKKLKEGK